VWDAEAVRHIISGLVIAGHRCPSCPSEVVVQHLSQCIIVGQSDIGQSLVEAGNRAAVHFVVLPVAAVHLDDGGLVTIGVGICAGATECLGPVSSEALDMLRMEAVAERMGYHVVRHHPPMPGTRKIAQAVVATCRLEDSLHASMMTMVPYSRKRWPRRPQARSGNTAANRRDQDKVCLLNVRKWRIIVF
jgi:hypothetical protein